MAKLNDHEVKYYDPIKFPKIEIEEAVAEAEVIIYAAPASAYKEILPKLPKDVPLILASKGFVSMKPFEKFKDFSVLGGAAFADTIDRAIKFRKKADEYDPIILTASSEIPEQLFTMELLKVEYTEDAKGVMLCGALKNVYAIGGGIFMLDEYPGEYLSEAYYEMQDILLANGCDPDTAMLSCGVADLMVSCTMDGRNFRFGDEIRMHPRSRIEPVGTIEGLNVIRSLDEFPDFVWPKDDPDYRPRRKKEDWEYSCLDDERSIMAQIVELVRYATE